MHHWKYLWAGVRGSRNWHTHHGEIVNFGRYRTLLCIKRPWQNHSTNLKGAKAKGEGKVGNLLILLIYSTSNLVVL
jgi:hypothetical protein